MSKIRVVLVDDEEHIVDLMKMQLALSDEIEVVGAGTDGRDALRLANALRPDVILLDIQMPNLNGLEATARIHSAFPSIAVVIASGNGSEEFVRTAMKAGAKDFLDKPVSAGALADAIIAANKKRDPGAPSKGLASVWAFYGSKANSGSSTLAVNTAVDLATLGYRTLLVDLDLVAGDCARYLKQSLSPFETDVFTRLAQLADLTAETVKPLVHRVELAAEPPLSIDTLMTPGQFRPIAQRAPQVLRGVFDVMIPMYDYIIVDLPPARLFERHVGLVLDYAERFFMVANSETSSLAAVRAVTSTLSESEFAFERLSLVLSSLIAQPNLNPHRWLTDYQVPLRGLLEMPLDTKACAQAHQTGVPVLLAEPRSAYSQFVRSLVDHALNRQPRTGEESTLWGKLTQFLQLR